MMLAELGADVVRVDRPGESNPLALAGGLRRSRPSIAVDLKTEAGRAVVQRLVDDADVLVEGYRPGRRRAARASGPTSASPATPGSCTPG